MDESTVKILVKNGCDCGNDECSGGSGGSGFVVKPEVIVTNWHVVANVTDGGIVVTDSNGAEFSATVLGTNQQSDVAVLSVPGLAAPAVTFSEPQTMELVKQVGYPYREYNEEMLITAFTHAPRVQSLKFIDFDDSVREYSHRETVMFFGRTQSGSSGGPIYNHNHEVIGMLYGGNEYDRAFGVRPEVVQREVERYTA